ncbi:hypothetical protein R1flu_015943 [Riccia fluitans]|uniref:DNA polymerase lambda n=1 Tax=Riccia fluitans TaxID=41844 RepID=A0ABD1YNH7_9MARC
MKPRGSKQNQRLKCASKGEQHGGLFSGLHAIFIELGVSRKRLQVWQNRFETLGGTVLTSKSPQFDQDVQIIVLASHRTAISKGFNFQRLRFSTKLSFVEFKWIEECLQSGKLLPYESYSIETSQDGFVTTKEGEVCVDSEHSTAAPAVVSSVADDHIIASVNLVHVKTNDGVIGECTDDGNLDSILDDDTPDYNKDLSRPLLELSEIYANVFGDEWRSFTYRKVANKLDKLPYKVSNADELKSIQGIGKSMITKVKEILSTGQLQKLVNLKANTQVQIMQLFASVWGIGPKVARRLYQAGHRSLIDVSGDSALSSMARIGLKYHHDISQRIPQAEVAAAGAFVRDILENLCPGAVMTVGGSYRRGHATCGDIDLLITHPDGHSHNGLLGRLLSILQELEFLVPFSSSSAESSTHKVDTYMGICKHPQYPHYRRIDFKFYPKECYAFALVYFTGNDVLNRRIRYLARTKGYKLSDQGLYPRIGSHKDAQASETSIPYDHNLLGGMHTDYFNGGLIRDIFSNPLQIMYPRFGDKGRKVSFSFGASNQVQFKASQFSIPHGYRVLVPFGNPCTLLNGSLYWLAYEAYGYDPSEVLVRPLVKFDLQLEEWTVARDPEPPSEVSDIFQIAALEEKIVLLDWKGDSLLNDLRQLGPEISLMDEKVKDFVYDDSYPVWSIGQGQFLYDLYEDELSRDPLKILVYDQTEGTVSLLPTSEQLTGSHESFWAFRPSFRAFVWNWRYIFCVGLREGNLTFSAAVQENEKLALLRLLPLSAQTKQRFSVHMAQRIESLQATYCTNTTGKYFTIIISWVH